jgi:hypothetical protein
MRVFVLKDVETWYGLGMKKRIWPIILGVFFILGPAVWMTFSVTQESRVGCEVCVQFDRQTKCVKASGPTRQTCQRTGVDNACGTMARGVQASIQCTQKRPVRVEFF